MMTISAYTGWLLVAALVAVVVVLLWWYAVRPMRTIARGVDLLQEPESASRLAPVSNPWANRIVTLFNRMMDQLREERLQLREKNHFFDLLFQASPMGVVLMDFDGHITGTNPAADALLADPLLRPRILAVPRGETQVLRQGSRRILRLSHLTFMDRGFHHPVLLIENLSDEVRKVERDAYGRVIRMISHEVNNTLAGAGSLLDMACQDATSPELRDMLMTCGNRYRQMADFVTRLADVVRVPAPVREQVVVQDFVLLQSRFLENLCRQTGGMQLRLSLDSEPLRVSMDIALMEQVLINVVKNACESSAAGSEVEVAVTARPASLMVTDHGKGISAQEEQQLFTPFHSTKPTGQGIGLMLVQEVRFIRKTKGPQSSASISGEGPSRHAFEPPHPIRCPMTVAAWPLPSGVSREVPTDTAQAPTPILEFYVDILNARYQGEYAHRVVHVQFLGRGRHESGLPSLERGSFGTERDDGIEGPGIGYRILQDTAEAVVHLLGIAFFGLGGFANPYVRGTVDLHVGDAVDFFAVVAMVVSTEGHDYFLVTSPFVFCF